MSDLDNEELEATRLLKNIEQKEIDEMIKSTEKSIEETCKFLKYPDVAIVQEKSADEMFEELGYEKDEKHTRYIKYGTSPSYGIIISFNLLKKRVCANTFDEVAEWNDAYDINMQELKAIYKYCEEKGWIE